MKNWLRSSGVLSITSVAVLFGAIACGGSSEGSATDMTGATGDGDATGTGENGTSTGENGSGATTGGDGDSGDGDGGTTGGGGNSNGGNTSTGGAPSTGGTPGTGGDLSCLIAFEQPPGAGAPPPNDLILPPEFPIIPVDPCEECSCVEDKWVCTTDPTCGQCTGENCCGDRELIGNPTCETGWQCGDEWLCYDNEECPRAARNDIALGVVVSAKNPETGTCCSYGSSTQVPLGWEVGSCQAAIPEPFPQ